MGISPIIAGMTLRQAGKDPSEDPKNKEQEDPRMTKKKVEQPKAFQRLKRDK